MPTALKYRSYAKINLYLDVLNRRRDGYHNIETIFQTVSLYDELFFEEQPNQLSMTCSMPSLDTGEGNLVYRAAMLLRARTGCGQGARIHLEKRIPVAAGLAGGSGNGAAALVGLNVLWDLRLRPGHLRALALELGSDVPYCVLGGTAAATRRGEELSKLPQLERRWFVLVHPEIAVSASHTYNHAQLGHNLEPRFAGRTPSFRRALRKLAAGALDEVVFNRMEPPVFSDHPLLARIMETLDRAGCTAAAMSGSGPTVFGLCMDKRHADRVAERMGEWHTSVVQAVPVGVERME